MSDTTSDDPTIIKANWPFYWISQINSAYAEALDRRIKQIGVDMPRWRAMASLHEDKYLSVSEIAQFSAQKLNTTTKVVQRMIADGLVVTRVRPSDGRVTEVCLTEKGDALRSAAMKEAHSIFAMVFEGIPEEKVKELNQTLSEIHEKLVRL